MRNYSWKMQNTSPVLTVLLLPRDYDLRWWIQGLIGDDERLLLRFPSCWQVDIEPRYSLSIFLSSLFLPLDLWVGRSLKRPFILVARLYFFLSICVVWFSFFSFLFTGPFYLLRHLSDFSFLFLFSYSILSFRYSENFFFFLFFS